MKELFSFIIAYLQYLFLRRKIVIEIASVTELAGGYAYVTFLTTFVGRDTFHTEKSLFCIENSKRGYLSVAKELYRKTLSRGVKPSPLFIISEDYQMLGLTIKQALRLQ